MSAPQNSYHDQAGDISPLSTVENVPQNSSQLEQPRYQNTNQTIHFSLDNLAVPSSPSKDADIIQRMESFKKKYEQMAEDIEASSKLIEKSSNFAEATLRSAVLLQYRRKLHVFHHTMQNIDKKVLLIQERLNNIRKLLPARKHSLVESGPFLYKCTYPGGVRYREYPSANAKVVSEDAIVIFNQVVEIAERVFIASEHSVFLHCKGSGWLFENKKDIVCFQRVVIFNDDD